MDPGFGLINGPRDFLNKARREANRLAVAESDPRADDDLGRLHDRLHDIVDFAINAAMALWHVTDWVANSDDPRAQAALNSIAASRTLKRPPKGRAPTPYDYLSDYVLDESTMALCQALANGPKHAVLRWQPALDPTMLFIGPAPGAHAGTAAVTIESHATVSGAVSAAGPGRLFAKLLIYDHRNPTKPVTGSALEVFQRALAYWESFFAKHGL